MLPVPFEARGLGGIRALHPSMQRIDAAAILGSKAIDLRHV
jgi:hypothetical protein